VSGSLATAQTYFEDLQLGEVVVSPGVTLTEALVRLYQGVTGDGDGDPTVIPPLLPLALSTGLGWRVPRAPLAVSAFLSFEWEIVHPLRVGDTIHGTARATARRPMREGGLIIEDHELIDQRGVVVQRGRFTFLVARRPAGPTTEKGESSP
jgi:acyl dehydratase